METPGKAVFGKHKPSLDYRAHQKAAYDFNIEDGIFAREQLIHNVRLDKIAKYKTQLASSGKSYSFVRPIPAGSMNCTGAANIALLKAGVLNIPISVPGVLSLQMYARQFGHLSYLLAP